MSERLEYKGKLFEKEGQAQSLALVCTGKVEGLRRVLDPTEAPAALDVDAIRERAFDLVKSLVELKALHAEITRIKKVLEL